MRISVDEARGYFAHRTQQEKAGIAPEQLPDEGFHYYAQDGVCGVFHRIQWPNVWMAHYGVYPSAWGRTTRPALAILSEFWDAEKPALIVGWTDEANRAALSFARRIGFKEHGRMVLPDQTVIMQGWSK